MGRPCIAPRHVENSTTNILTSYHFDILAVISKILPIKIETWVPNLPKNQTMAKILKLTSGSYLKVFQTSCGPSWRCWNSASHTVVEVQEFIGFLNFYWRFVQNFYRIVWPLNDLTKKNDTFHWTNKCQGVFNELKQCTTEALILVMIHNDGPIQVETDNCWYVTGALISQEQEGNYKPITYYLKSFNDVEQNSPTHNQELYAIMHALKEWHHYLVRKRFENWTDHKNLKWFMTKWDLNWQQASWALDLAEYNFILKYKRVHNDPSRCFVVMAWPSGGDGSQQHRTSAPPTALIPQTYGGEPPSLQNRNQFPPCPNTCRMNDRDNQGYLCQRYQENNGGPR